MAPREEVRVATREEGHVAGMSEAMKQAEAGMKLFKKEVELPTDKAGAEKFKAEVDEQIAALEAEAEKLTGKDNMKARSAKGKEAMDMKHKPQYIDACKVVKGLQPVHGFFIIGSNQENEPPKAAPKQEAKVEQSDAKAEPKKDEKK